MLKITTLAISLLTAISIVAPAQALPPPGDQPGNHSQPQNRPGNHSQPQPQHQHRNHFQPQERGRNHPHHAPGRGQPGIQIDVFFGGGSRPDFTPNRHQGFPGNDRGSFAPPNSGGIGENRPSFQPPGNLPLGGNGGNPLGGRRGDER